jgi:methyl-accepting chemotaxis protein
MLTVPLRGITLGGDMSLIPRTIAGKLVVYLGLTNCVVLTATVWFSYVRARQILVEQIDSAALKQLRTTTARLDDFLGKAATRAQMIASRQLALQRSMVAASGRAFDPGLLSLLVRMLKDAPEDEAYGLWFCRTVAHDRGVREADLLAATHRHTWPNRTVFPPEYVATIPDQEWYSGPVKSGKPYMTEPYYDEGGGNTSMVSLSHPCFDERRNLVAVSGVDVELARIYGLVSEIQNSGSGSRDAGFAFLVSGSGRIIAHPDTKLMLGKGNPGARVADLPEGPTVLDRPEGASMVRLAGADRRLYWVTAPAANWKVVLNVPNAVVSGPVGDLAMRAGLLGCAGVVFSSLVLVMIARGISRPVVRLTSIAQQVAAGDLRGARKGLDAFADPSAGAGPAPDRPDVDETGQLLSAIRIMTDNLSSLIGQVQRSGLQVRSTAGLIAAASKQQEGTVHTFGGSTTQVTASAREISATSQELLTTMDSVSQVAAQTAELAESGRILLHNRQEAMNQLLAATGAISGKLSVISERAGEISEVITTITRVSEQTNLLSLNAAIEAEKAGDAGLGFAVVAREIRRLADQTAVAAVDIERMVKEMQLSVSGGVTEMGRFSQGVSRDVEEMGELTAQLDQIIRQVQGLTTRFAEVNEGMRAQSQGAEQISEAMAHLSDAARRTAASVNEFNQATEELGVAVAGLQEQVSRFRIV